MADAEPRLIHQGILIKSPPENKSKDLSRWRKRYFKLWSSKTLEYYRSEKSKDTLRKPIDLNKCKSIDGHLKNKKWENIFCLNTNERKFFLVANSAEDMLEWIDKICDVCGFNMDGSKSPIDNSVFNCSGAKSPPNSPSNTRQDDGCATALPEKHDSVAIDCPTSALHSIPSYDEDLPPIPKSPTRPHTSTESPSSAAVTEVSTSPYGAHVKQNRQNIYTDSPSSCYDSVPPPIPLEPNIPKRRMSSPAESARLNMIIKDESYVDMSPDNGTYDMVPPPRSSGSFGHKLGTYDLVPPPVKANGCGRKTLSRAGCYDLVPPPRAALDEYVDCDVSPPNPPLPDPTYTGFDTLPSIQNRNRQTTSYHESTGDIYDVPPSAAKYNESIYDIPPRPDEDAIQDSIYDRPPSQSPFSESSRNSIPLEHTENDSIYDQPPNSSSYTAGDPLYDTPPIQNPGFSDNSIYDFPPSPQVMTPLGIYDVPPSPAELFNFSMGPAPPRVDRALKYASTSNISAEKALPPCVDRSNRPTLTASVPVFPSHIDTDTHKYTNTILAGSDSIYDLPPTRSEIDRYAAQDCHDQHNNASPQAMSSPETHPRGNLQYSQFDYLDNKEHTRKQRDSGNSTSYSSIDPELTAAVRNARISRESDQLH